MTRMLTPGGVSVAAIRQQMVAPTDQRLASLQRDLASPGVLPARPGLKSFNW